MSSVKFSKSCKQASSDKLAPTNASEPDVGLIQSTASAVPNILNNGNFEQGAVGFGSDYTFVAQNSGGVAQYGIRSNSISFNSQFCSIANHTSNGNSMLIMDGSNVATNRFWFYTVPVKANTSYTFTYWYATLDTYTPAQVQIKINGASKNITTFSTTSCTWFQVQLI